MLTAKNFEDEEQSKGSQQIPYNSLMSILSGSGNLKLSRYYPRGSVLFFEGQSFRGVYVLCQGRAKESISSAEGKILVLRIAQPGDLLGLNSALTGAPYDVTVSLLEDCRIDFVSRADFTKLLEKSKTARFHLSEALSCQLREVTECARSLLLSRSAAEKLARLLLKWCDELGEPTPQGICLNHGLTREEIAQMICTSRETVSRILTELERKQIVRLNGAEMFVRNRAALEFVA